MEDKVCHPLTCGRFLHFRQTGVSLLIELYAADIRQIAPKAESLVRLLDDERQERVRSLGNSNGALRCLAAGLLLYHVFGPRIRDAHFSRGTLGKPALSGETPFNLSHAGDYAVLARSGEPVGVDLERIRPIDWRRISARYFHPEEQSFLQSSSYPLESFFWIWTLKESYIKAEGGGLSIPLGTFCILPQGKNAACLNRKSPYEFRRYFDFPGYCLSLCGIEREVSSQIMRIDF